MIQFDYLTHVFQMGWNHQNHQPAIYSYRLTCHFFAGRSERGSQDEQEEVVEADAALEKYQAAASGGGWPARQKMAIKLPKDEETVCSKDVR